MDNHLPIFQQVLGKPWDSLGEIIQRHYFLKPFSNDGICVSGAMEEIHHSALAKLFIPVALLFGAIVPYRGRNVPIDVHYKSDQNTQNIYWDRVFRFDGRKEFHFRSVMEPVKDNLVIEFVKFGLGMKLRVTAEEGAIVFRDEGYIWRVLGLDIPLPIKLVLGSAYVEERPIDSNYFSMKMLITHPLFGRLFSYKGVFSLEQPLEQAIQETAAMEEVRS